MQAMFDGILSRILEEQQVNIFVDKCPNFSGGDNLFNYPFMIVPSKSTTSSNVTKHGLHVWPQVGADMWSWELCARLNIKSYEDVWS